MQARGGPLLPSNVTVQLVQNHDPWHGPRKCQISEKHRLLLSNHSITMKTDQIILSQGHALVRRQSFNVRWFCFPFLRRPYLHSHEATKAWETILLNHSLLTHSVSSKGARSIQYIDRLRLMCNVTLAAFPRFIKKLLWTNLGNVAIISLFVYNCSVSSITRLKATIIYLRVNLRHWAHLSHTQCFPQIWLCRCEDLKVVSWNAQHSF